MGSLFHFCVHTAPRACWEFTSASSHFALIMLSFLCGPPLVSQSSVGGEGLIQSAPQF